MPEPNSPLLTARERLEIRRRCEAASPPPWTFEESLPGQDDIPLTDGRYCVVFVHDAKIGVWELANGVFENKSGGDYDEYAANYRFIAHARTDLPAALDEIDRLEAGQDALRRDLDAALQVMVDAGLSLDDMLAKPITSAARIASLERDLHALQEAYSTLESERNQLRRDLAAKDDFAKEMADKFARQSEALTQAAQHSEAGRLAQENLRLREALRDLIDDAWGIDLPPRRQELYERTLEKAEALLRGEGA